MRCMTVLSDNLGTARGRVCAVCDVETDEAHEVAGFVAWESPSGQVAGKTPARYVQGVRRRRVHCVTSSRMQRAGRR